MVAVRVRFKASDVRFKLPGLTTIWRRHGNRYDNDRTFVVSTLELLEHLKANRELHAKTVEVAQDKFRATWFDYMQKIARMLADYVLTLRE